MKKCKSMIAAMAILCYGVLLFLSCNKDGHVSSKDEGFNGMDPRKSGQTINWGQFHNDMLAYVIEKFDGSIDFNDVPEVVDYANAISLEYVDNLKLDEETKKIIKEELQLTKNNVSTPDFFDSLFSGQYSYLNSVDILFETKMIEKFDREQLLSIYGVIEDVFGKKISNEDAVKKIRTYANDGRKGTNSMVADVIYDVALSSSEFWEMMNEKPIEVEPTPAEYLPPQVIADIGGAVVGAAASTAIQYGQTGHVNGRTVLISAGVTCVTSSLGAAAKVGNAVVKAASKAGKFLGRLIK